MGDAESTVERSDATQRGGWRVVTGESVELAYVDQGYTGEAAAQAAEAQGIRLEVVKLQEAKKGFVLLPRAGLWSAALAGQRGSSGCRAITNA